MNPLCASFYPSVKWRYFPNSQDVKSFILSVFVKKLDNQVANALFKFKIFDQRCYLNAKYLLFKFFNKIRILAVDMGDVLSYLSPVSGEIYDLAKQPV